MICVKYKGELKRITGIEEETVDCTTLKELLYVLKKIHGREILKAIRPCHIIVNGKRANSKLKLQNNDEVVFIPVCCGG
ncbi:MAG: MoaD/ThiS family protein [Eubacterium sp.]